MFKRIVEGKSEKRELPEICEWLPNPEFGEFNREYNLCRKDCDGRNTECRYHPRHTLDLTDKYAA